MSGAASEVVNPDLRQIHSALVHLVRDLNEAIGRAKTSSEVNVITGEIAELNARVTSVGRQLLTQQTDDIRRETEHVMSVVPEIQEEISRLDDLQAFIGAATSFLAVVDKAVSVAKLVI